MSAQDKLSENLDKLFPHGEAYVTVDDGDICIDGHMTLDTLNRLTRVLGDYFEETKACPF